MDQTRSLLHEQRWGVMHNTGDLMRNEMDGYRMRKESMRVQCHKRCVDDAFHCRQCRGASLKWKLKSLVEREWSSLCMECCLAGDVFCGHECVELLRPLQRRITLR